jgi:uncharacterized repeat protein (TIGR03803 family)
VLYSFCSRKNCRDGSDPLARLIFDQAGNLYGTAHSGGAHGYGVVFKLVPNLSGEWTETVLAAFADDPGAYPRSGLIFDGAGNLYGTTRGDGVWQYGKTHGLMFEITP